VIKMAASGRRLACRVPGGGHWSMRTIALLVLALALPTAAGYFLLATLGGWHKLAEALRRPPPPESPDRLAATLRRLRVQLETTETTPGATAKNHRIRALRGAYLDALHLACTRLEVSPPAGGDRASQAEIYRAEAALRERGLDVREPAAR
jgi:hypothetical protein